MARFHHTVTVASMERHRLDEYAEPVRGLAESTRSRGQEIVLPGGRAVPGLRLLRGRHLQPGARHRSAAPEDAEPEALVVREWRRGNATAAEQVPRSPGFADRVAVRLRAPDRPRSLEIEGRMRGPERTSGRPGALQSGSGKAKPDLPARWATAAVAPGCGPAGPRPGDGPVEAPAGQCASDLHATGGRRGARGGSMRR
jgi:hypothetical protein